MSHEPRTRFVPFTNEELVELWDGITTDDGIQFGFDDANRDVDAELARELYAEAVHRGLHETDELRWQYVVNPLPAPPTNERTT